MLKLVVLKAVFVGEGFATHTGQTVGAARLDGHFEGNEQGGPPSADVWWPAPAPRACWILGIWGPRTNLSKKRYVMLSKDQIPLDSRVSNTIHVQTP